MAELSITGSAAYRVAFEKYIRRQTLTEAEQQLLDQARTPDPEPFTEAELLRLETLAKALNDG